jgi:hypothetical protein
MDAHNGRIEVQSKPGAGTEFRLTIPLADAARGQPRNGLSEDKAEQFAGASAGDRGPAVETGAIEGAPSTAPLRAPAGERR